MNIILDNKVQRIKWLCEEEMVLQHVHSRKLVTSDEYSSVRSIRNPGKRMTELLDIILKKGDSVCMDFLKLLKEDHVNESRPELREWIVTVNTADLGDKTENSNTPRAGAVTITDYQEFLLKNRSKLIDNVKTVDRIVDDLDLSNEMAANVRAERTEPAKMRKVLEYTNSRKAARFLVDVLFKHVPDVMEELTAAQCRI